MNDKDLYWFTLHQWLLRGLLSKCLHWTKTSIQLPYKLFMIKWTLHEYQITGTMHNTNTFQNYRDIFREYNRFILTVWIRKITSEVVQFKWICSVYLLFRSGVTHTALWYSTCVKLYRVSWNLLLESNIVDRRC